MTELRGWETMNDWRTTKVLDHGFVHLRDSMPSLLLPIDVVNGLGHGDYRIEEAARVSTSHLPASVLNEIGAPVCSDIDRTPEQTKKLIKYMFEHDHWTPFEQVKLTFVAKLPIFVARQWIRHRAGAFNEQSARYSKLPCEFYVPTIERMQAQSTVNKQGSAEQLPEHVVSGLQEKIRAVSESAYVEYESMLDHGLTRELARMVLPTNFYTEWYWSVDFRNFLGFCALRCDSHAQWEIQRYAFAMLEMARHVAPFAVGLFCEKHDFGGARG